MGEKDEGCKDTSPKQHKQEKGEGQQAHKKRAEGNPGFAAIFMFNAAVCAWGWGFLNILREQRRGRGETVRSLHCVIRKAKQTQRM